MVIGRADHRVAKPSSWEWTVGGMVGAARDEAKGSREARGRITIDSERGSDEVLVLTTVLGLVYGHEGLHLPVGSRTSTCDLSLPSF